MKLKPKIIQLHLEGRQVFEIAAELWTDRGYVRQVINQYKILNELNHTSSKGLVIPDVETLTKQEPSIGSFDAAKNASNALRLLRPKRVEEVSEKKVRVFYDSLVNY
jgi:hypothetical protein